MCELLALSFNEPVRPDISFRGFRRRGEENPDGWGMGFFPDKSVEIIKEPIKAGKSYLSRVVKDYPRIRSKLFIAHVRNATKGSVSHMNTHPFQRELNGREYVFAHNGTISDFGGLPLGGFSPWEKLTQSIFFATFWLSRNSNT